jgi:hypothetical protein
MWYVFVCVRCVCVCVWATGHRYFHPYHTWYCTMASYSSSLITTPVRSVLLIVLLSLVICSVVGDNFDNADLNGNGSLDRSEFR